MKKNVMSAIVFCLGILYACTAVAQQDLVFDYNATTGSETFTETFKATGDGTVAFNPPSDGNAEYQVYGQVYECTQCWAFSNGVCTDCRGYGYRYRLKQDWTSTASTSVNNGDDISLRVRGPASAGLASRIGKLAFPNASTAQMTVSYDANPFTNEFMTLMQDFERHVFFHAENPEIETIRTLRNATVEAAQTIKGLQGGGVQEPSSTPTATYAPTGQIAPDYGTVNAVFVADMVFPTNPTDGMIWEMGGHVNGAWMGIRNGGSVLRLRAGDGKEEKTGPTTDTAVIDLLDFPKDGQVHEVIWDFDRSTGTARLFIDGELKGQSSATSGAFLNTNYAGVGDGAYLVKSTTTVTVGEVGDPSNFVNSGAGLRVYEGTLVSQTEISPIFIEVPSEVGIVKNNMPIPKSIDGSSNRVEVANDDVISLRTTGSDTSLFNINNTVAAGRDVCTTDLTEDGAIACHVIPVTFVSGDFSETLAWPLGRAEIQVASGQVSQSAAAISDFEPVVDKIRGSIITSNTVQVTTTSQTPVDYSIQLRVSDDPDSDILLSQTSLIIDGENIGSRSAVIEVSLNNPVDVAIQTSIKPNLEDTTGGTAKLDVLVGETKKQWSISWTGISPDLTSIIAALNASSSGLGDRLASIVSASVAEYGFSTNNNVYVDNLRITPIARLVNFLEANPNMTLMSPRTASALAEATQDSRRVYGEQIASAPLSLEGLFFEDNLNAPISTIVETSAGAVLTPNIAGVNPSTSVAYADGDTVPVTVIQRQGNPQFRTAAECTSLSSSVWQDFTGSSSMVVGECIQLRLTSSPSYNTLRAVQFTAGDSDSIWRVKTRSVPVDMADFTSISGLDWDTLTESLEAQPIVSSDGTAIAATLATPSGEGSPEICVVSSSSEPCNSGWTSSSVVMNDGDFAWLRTTSAATSERARVASVILGDVTDPNAPRADFVVTTAPGLPPVLENNIGAGDFVDLFNQPTDTLVYSNEIIFRQQAGDPSSVWYVEVTDQSASGAVISLNGNAYEAGFVEVAPDDGIRLSHRTPSAENTLGTSVLRVYDAPDNTRTPLLERVWNTTTGVGIQSCNVSARAEGRWNPVVLDWGMADGRQMPGIMQPTPGIIPGDEVAIDLGRLDEIDAWKSGYPKNPFDDYFYPPSTSFAREGTGVDPAGYNSRGFFEDLTCDQSNGVGFTPTAVDPGEPYFVEISDYIERYASAGCCTAPEFSYLGYPYGRAVNDPITTPLVYDHNGGSNESVLGTINYTPMTNYGGRARTEEDQQAYTIFDLNNVGAYANISTPEETQISNPPLGFFTYLQTLRPESGGVASDYFVPKGEFGLNDPANAYLIINGVPSGQGAMVLPGDTVELGLKVSEGLYEYEVTLLANGYAQRKVTADVTSRPPLGTVEPRGQDFGTYELPASGFARFDDVVTVPPIMSDPANYYPPAIRSLRGSFDMQGPLMMVYVPLNKFAEALMRGNGFSNATPEVCTDPNTGLPVVTSGRKNASTVDELNNPCDQRGFQSSSFYIQGNPVGDYAVENFTVVSPVSGAHTMDTLTTPISSDGADGPDNRRFGAMSGETYGFQVRHSPHLQGDAEFGVYLLNYERLPDGVGYTHHGIRGNWAYTDTAKYNSFTVNGGENPTLYGSDLAWQDNLLGTFTVTRAGLTPPSTGLFNNLVDELPSRWSYSNVAEMTGIPSTANISIAGASGQLSINGGPWVTSGTIVEGDTVQLRQMSSPSLGDTVTSIVTIN